MSKLLVFCVPKSKKAIHLWKRVNSSHHSVVKRDGHSFLMSNWRDLLLGIKKGKTVKNCQKHTQNIFKNLSKSLVFCEWKSNLLVNKSKSLTLVFSKVQGEWFAHSCFFKSDMSDLLTVTLWATEQRAKIKSLKSERANSLFSKKFKGQDTKKMNICNTLAQNHF